MLLRWVQIEKSEGIGRKDKAKFEKYKTICSLALAIASILNPSWIQIKGSVIYMSSYLSKWKLRRVWNVKEFGV